MRFIATIKLLLLALAFAGAAQATDISQGGAVRGQWMPSAGGSGGNTPTPQPTATPLVFGTPGQIPVFANPELGTFAGSTCPTPQIAVAIDPSGALTCGTPTAGGGGGATPTPLVFGTPGVIAIFASPELGQYTGSICPTPQIAVGVNSNGALTCGTPLPTPTPLAFGTPGVLAAFNATELGSYAGTTCPTPGTVVTSINASGSATCGFSQCPAGPARAVQYKNDALSCAGDVGLQYQYDNPTLDLTADNTAPRGVQAALRIYATQNTANAGTQIQLNLAGTSGNAAWTSYDRGVATGSVARYFNVGLDASDGNFYFTDGSSNADVVTGTTLLEFVRGATKQILIDTGSGSSSVPALSFVTASNTGWAETTASGGGGARINTIVNGTTLTYHEVTNGSANRFGIEYTTILTPLVNNSLSGAGPTEIAVDRTLLELSTSNGAGTAICPNNTNVAEGQIVKIVNTSNNDLTIAETNTATCKVHTTGGATQTLANAYDNIEFLNLNGFWVQSGAIEGP